MYSIKQTCKFYGEQIHNFECHARSRLDFTIDMPTYSIEPLQITATRTPYWICLGWHTESCCILYIWCAGTMSQQSKCDDCEKSCRHWGSCLALYGLKWSWECSTRCHPTFGDNRGCVGKLWRWSEHESYLHTDHNNALDLYFFLPFLVPHKLLKRSSPTRQIKTSVADSFNETDISFLFFFHCNLFFFFGTTCSFEHYLRPLPCKILVGN